jgi:drug/metabolite transporter (DMT)-like permease
MVTTLRQLAANSTPHNKALLLMTLGGFMFASMGALIHALGKEVDWLLIAFIRMVLSFVITLVLALRADINPFLLTRPLLWFRSLIGSSAMLATFYALTVLPISDVAVITESRPIWVALLAGYLLGESSGKKIWISIIFGMLGILLVEHPIFTSGSFAGAAALYAAIGGAAVMICLRKLRDLDPRVIVTHFSATATIITFLALITVRGEADFAQLGDMRILLMLLGVGVLGTLGQLAMTKAFSMGEAPSVASAGFVKVGFSAGYDIFIWKYVFEYPTILGMLLILGSTMWLFKRKQKPSELKLPGKKLDIKDGH